MTAILSGCLRADYSDGVDSMLKGPYGLVGTSLVLFLLSGLVCNVFSFFVSALTMVRAERLT